MGFGRATENTPAPWLQKVVHFFSSLLVPEPNILSGPRRNMFSQQEKRFFLDLHACVSLRQVNTQSRWPIRCGPLVQL